MSFRLVLLLVASFVVMSGCFDTEDKTYTCADGKNVSNALLCQIRKPPMTQPGVNLDVCKNVSGEEKDTCISLIALEHGDRRICSMVESLEWRNICYLKLNATDAIVSTSIVTTTVPAPRTTRSTTSTTLLCGNGVLDEGEECDIGSMCKGMDGLCSLVGLKNDRFVCLSGETCNWNVELSASGYTYDMGSCIGCYGNSQTYECTCMREIRPLATTTTLAVVSSKCDNGICVWSEVDGPVECGQNRDCFHFECEGLECVMEKTPGNNTCTQSAECMSIWV